MALQITLRLPSGISYKTYENAYAIDNPRTHFVEIFRNKVQIAAFDRASCLAWEYVATPQQPTASRAQLLLSNSRWGSHEFLGLLSSWIQREHYREFFVSMLSCVLCPTVLTRLLLHMLPLFSAWKKCWRSVDRSIGCAYPNCRQTNYTILPTLSFFRIANHQMIRKRRWII